MSDLNVYWQNGFRNRREYLEYLADEYNIDISVVISFATILGEDEDFEGLVLTLSDYEEYMKK